MPSKVLTFVIDTVEQELDTVIAAAVNEIHNLGHKTKEVRVMDDTGETKVALNTVEGVTPEAAGNPPEEPAPEPTPEPTPTPEPATPEEVAVPPVAETETTPPEPPNPTDTVPPADTPSAP